MGQLLVLGSASLYGEFPPGFKCVLTSSSEVIKTGCFLTEIDLRDVKLSTAAAVASDSDE